MDARLCFRGTQHIRASTRVVDARLWLAVRGGTSPDGTCKTPLVCLRDHVVISNLPVRAGIRRQSKLLLQALLGPEVEPARRLWLARMRWNEGSCHHRLVRPTVLIVDDHADFRRATSALLEAEGFHVVGEAANGEEAVRAVALLRPQVVLLDIQLPGLDGLAVAEQLAAGAAPPAVVLISSRGADAYGKRLQRSPAKGFIPKRALSGEAILALLAL